jgi:hypothetical protein
MVVVVGELLAARVVVAVDGAAALFDLALALVEAVGDLLSIDLRHGRRPSVRGGVRDV